LTTSGGEVNTNPAILSALREFYKNLYTAENTDPISQDFMVSKLSMKHPEEEKNALEGELSLSECLTELEQTKSGRSPSIDGFPANSINTFGICSERI
jgi:hypothetical protein